MCAVKAEVIINEKIYHFVSRNLIINELPMFFDKPDTVYRNLRTLEEKGLIEYSKKDKMDLIKITEKGKEWNFIKSENNSEKNPTYKDTILHKDTILKKIYIDRKYKSEKFEQTFYDFLDMRKKIKKPATEKAIELILNKLEKINNEELSIQMLENSILNNWQDVYEPKERGKDGNTKYQRNNAENRKVIERDYYAGTDDWNK